MLPTLSLSLKWDALVNMGLVSPQLGDLVYKWANEPWLLLGKNDGPLWEAGIQLRKSVPCRNGWYINHLQYGMVVIEFTSCVQTFLDEKNVPNELERTRCKWWNVSTVATVIIKDGYWKWSSHFDSKKKSHYHLSRCLQHSEIDIVNCPQRNETITKCPSSSRRDHQPTPHESVPWVYATGSRPIRFTLGLPCCCTMDHLGEYKGKWWHIILGVRSALEITFWKGQTMLWSIMVQVVPGARGRNSSLSDQCIDSTVPFPSNTLP